jgi:hypothetical protein
MIYIYTLVFLFIILSTSNFLTLKFNIKNNQSYFISCCLIILLAFLSFFIDKVYKFVSLKYLFYFFFLFSIYFLLFLIPNFSKIKKKINLEFIFLFLIFFFVSKDRYYLDQDEFTYWGRSLKELSLALEPYNHFNHHPKGTSLFQYLLIFFKHKEGLAIFANNILLISGYFYLFYERKLSTIEKIILFLIYYLLLNNLSFGFLSIYSDPILAVFFSCLLKLIYFFVTKDIKEKNLQVLVSFFIIFLALLLINRASIVYALFLLFTCFAFFLFKNKKNNIIYFIYFFGILLIFFYIYIFNDFILRGNYDLQTLIQNVINFAKYQLFSINFVELFTSPIYFSHFGALVNGILIFFSLNNFFPEFQIPLLVYILLLGLILLFNFRYKFFFILISFFSIFIYSSIVFILKFQIEKISILALQRYIGIFLLANYLFYISIINNNFRIIYKNYILISFIIFLVSVAPKKTVGLFVTDKIYYSNLSNKNFKINRDTISQLKNINNIDSIFLIHKNAMSDYTNNNIAGEHTFYHDIISYELYPKQITFVEYDKFKKNINYYKSFKDNNSFFIFYDLSKNQLTNINFFQNFFIINTY